MKNLLLISVFFTFGLICKGQTVSDIDGNIYNTINIGTQTWMVENLRTTKFNDGTVIPNVIDNTAWSALTTPAVCTYTNTNNVDSIKTYGRLYNWYSVSTGKLAPSGWHVPTDAEWITLENYLIANGYNYDGTTIGNKYAKALSSSTGWNSATGSGSVGNTDYPTKRNVTGFTAIPGGYRLFDGSFANFGFGSYWWSSSEYSTLLAWELGLFYDASADYRNYGDKSCGNSVRCVKDITSSANNVNFSDINIFPNPSKGKLYFNNTKSLNCYLEIFNIQGELVLSRQIVSNSIDISNINNGIYFAKISDSGNIKITKFIKE